MNFHWHPGFGYYLSGVQPRPRRRLRVERDEGLTIRRALIDLAYGAALFALPAVWLILGGG